MTIQKKTYNVSEAAKVIGVGVTKVRQLCNTEGFPVIRVGSRIVIPIDRLDAWLNEAGKIAK